MHPDQPFFQIISQIMAKLFDFICDMIFRIIYLLSQHLANVVYLLANIQDGFMHASYVSRRL